LGWASAPALMSAREVANKPMRASERASDLGIFVLLVDGVALRE
jgi:hypothetical protein